MREIRSPSAPQVHSGVTKSSPPVLLQDGNRHTQPSTGAPIHPIMLNINRSRRPIIGHDRRNSPPRSIQIMRPNLSRNSVRIASPHVEEVPEELLRHSPDHRLREPRRLRHQIEMKPNRGRGTTKHLPHVQRRQHIQRRQMSNHLRMIQPSPDSHQRPPIVPSKREPLKPERTSNSDHIPRHSTLRISRTRVNRLVTLPIPPQVKTDHRVIHREISRDMPPHQMRLRKAVQQDNR